MSLFINFSHPVYLILFIKLFAAISTLPVLASETHVIISKKDCGQLTQEQFQSDKDFQAGIDVRGKKVKSAEHFSDENLTLPNQLSFKLNIDIAGNYGLDASTVSAVIAVGRIKLLGRKVYLNDRQLNARDSLAIKGKCKEIVQTP